VVQATAGEIIHEDVEMVRRFVFELPLSGVPVVDGERTVLEAAWRSRLPPRSRGTSTRRSRCAIQRDALLARPTLDGGATIVAYVIRAARTDRMKARRQGRRRRRQVEGRSRG